MIQTIYDKLLDSSDYTIIDPRSVNWSTFEFTNGFVKHYVAEEEILKSYSAQVKQVQVAFQELAISIGEAGLLDVLKKLASGGKSLTEALTGLSPEIKSALMVALALGAAFVTLNQVIKSKLLFSLAETIKALLNRQLII